MCVCIWCELASALFFILFLFVIPPVLNSFLPFSSLPLSAQGLFNHIFEKQKNVYQ